MKKKEKEMMLSQRKQIADLSMFCLHTYGDDWIKYFMYGLEKIEPKIYEAMMKQIKEKK